MGKGRRFVISSIIATRDHVNGSILEAITRENCVSENSFHQCKKSKILDELHIYL